jgi:hypothetical protein
MTSIDPPTAPKPKPKPKDPNRDKLDELRETARFLLERAARYDGPGSGYQADTAEAWEFVKRLARVKIIGG